MTPARPLAGAAALALAAALSACMTDPAADTRAYAAPGVGSAHQMTGVVPVAGLTAEAYVRNAAASDLFEIQSSQLALQRSQDPAVRRFAETMIAHHTDTTRRLTEAARAANMTPPAPMLTAEQTRMMQDLTRASAADFDRTYMTQQEAAHRVAWSIHAGYARDGQSAPLRAVAANAVPIVEGHHHMAMTDGRVQAASR